ncbi:MAG TPA: anthranilate phosphoribosyltransferase, partial [Acidimicrobiia bacterium]|nr:anthranilate phosphoribosyltransferase [Acidimicrobiia bacterium]
GGSVGDNVAILRRVLEGEAGPYRDAAVINTAPALVVSGVAEGFVEAVELAGRTIDSGAAGALLDRLVARSRSLRVPETG